MQVETAVHTALKTMRGVERDQIARFLIDPVVLFILAATSRRCLTVSEMAPVVNLPAATCYKLIYQMDKMGLVAYCGNGRNGGRGKAAAYTSVLKEMHLEMRNTIIVLRVTWKNGTNEEFRKDLVPPSADKCPFEVVSLLTAEADSAFSD
ncbi:MAG TPA: hypothetical protein PLC39_04775 [Methanomassiliicoccales archaeon]|nr:hypothetical protein [Methanomassiliicoccales archaeon]HNX47325.1 hypothetical protein [Methanomassiliicoccales archaeon]HPR98593.1 hypothetical protein [Methanomassiliicoccales archaeon]